MPDDFGKPDAFVFRDVPSPKDSYGFQGTTDPKAGEIYMEQLNNKYPDNMPASGNDADLNPWDVEIFG